MASKNFIDSARDLLLRSSNIGKSMLEKSFLEKERKDLFLRLGELTYSLCKSNKISEASLANLVYEIDSINEKLNFNDFTDFKEDQGN
jgi:hypothetical protein